MSLIRQIQFPEQSLDAFGRQRVSEPATLFDSKQIFDNQPLFWDESLATGAGITSAHSANTASTVITSTLNTAGKFTRQTYRRFNYQPGKSQAILMTGVLDLSGGGVGVQRRIGVFDDLNGLFFEDDAGVVKVVRRSYVTGSAVDVKVAQADWNVDKMDGTGRSQITVDWNKTQIFVVDFEWLGVGRVRFGLNIDGQTYTVHEMNNANNLTTVYMSTPNLPLRYQMETQATSAASSMSCICTSVKSEGGLQPLGVLRHSDSNAIPSLSTNTIYAVLGIRLKAGYIGASVLIENISMITTTVNDSVHWELIFNPTVAGTFTYNDLTNSAVQVALGANTNTVTGGTAIDGGYLNTDLPVSSAVENALLLGAAINGTVDTVVLCVKPITNNTGVRGSMTWRELL